MRTAEEILNEAQSSPLSTGRILKGSRQYESAINAINQARREAIEECAKRATTETTTRKRIKCIDKEPTFRIGQKDEITITTIDKDSILSLIKELK